MSNEEFDNLKEELMWEGSSVVMLSKHTLCIMNLILHTLEHSFAMNYYSTSRISIIMPGFFLLIQLLMNRDFLKLLWLMYQELQYCQMKNSTS